MAYSVLDKWGGCGATLKCPGHFRKNCPGIDVYKFYAAFENSNCDEYMTEKVFWNAYSKCKRHSDIISMAMGVKD